MNEREALKLAMDKFHADYVDLKRQRDQYERGIETCERLMSEAVKARAALSERYGEVIGVELVSVDFQR